MAALIALYIPHQCQVVFILPKNKPLFGFSMNSSR